ncbi:MAG TPA: UDP-N-acetylmuramate--L-alanine ligase [Egibacteraceae bacterium]|nr:UDP-N-acetylmuramate--L-alanine ligase [Egibacteraceae bacterium]
MTPADLLPGDARVHLIGVGGAGMSALAHILLERGHPVSGSDLRGGRACAALTAMGGAIAIGHEGRNVEGADVVVVSNAVPTDNPEVVRAGELTLPVLRRVELLEALMRGHRRLLVSGTHGKTTTTAMTTVCLQAAGLDPSFAIGGTLSEAGTSAHHGTGEVFVAEADEAYGSFAWLTPDAAVVTNVELDHHDHYADVDQVRRAFVAFLDRRPARPDGQRSGPAILCRDDAGAETLIDVVARPVSTYGEHADADLRITELRLAADGSRYRLIDRGEDLGEFRLRLPGRHNVANATAAAAAARWAGASSDAIRAALGRFAGAQRRFQRLGTVAGVTVVDDYGHHPTELTATLAAARQTAPAGRVVAVFQPHRYSRTAALGPELGRSLAGADAAVVTDVYAAGEDPVPGVTGTIVADAARAAGVPTHFVAAGGDLVEVVAGIVAEGDLVVTLGAGDITELGPVLLRRLENRRG